MIIVRRPLAPLTFAMVLAAATAARAATTDLGLSPYQAQTSWVSPHRDQQNSDFVPFATAVHYEVKWHAEDANMTLWAPSIGPQGNLYVCTGRAGDPNVHAYDRDGALVWETGVPLAGSDPNPVAAASLPFIDVDGDVYVSDNVYFWAYEADGTFKWKTAFPPHPDGPATFIGAPVVTSAGLIGGITNRGQVLFYDRATGAQVIATFELPGGLAPSGSPTPAGLWDGGELDSAYVDVFWAGFNGFDLEVANTQAIHPEIDRLYITATSSTTNMEGALYAIDLVGSQWQIAFEKPLGVNSGTSPALSPDSAQVYAVGGDNELAAYDASTGALVWTAPNVSAVASPQVAPDGTVYTGTETGSEVVAINPDGTTKWRRNYDFLARQMLTNLPFFGTILTDGKPVARADSVATVTGNNIKAVLKLGYDFQPPGGALNTIPNIVVLATLCPIDGQLLDYVEIADDSRGLISVAEDGHVFTSHAAAFTSIFYYFANPFVPAAARITGAPAAGFTALRPVSFLEQTIAGLVWTRGLATDAIAAAGTGDVAAALAAVKRGGVQLDASADSFFDAEADGEIASAQAAARAGDTADARIHFLAARTSLTSDPITQTALDAAVLELQDALAEIDAALESLPCDDGVVCTSADAFGAGECRGGMATTLSSVKLTIRLKDAAASAEKDKITLKATVPLADLPADPTVTGMTLEVANGDGKTFFSGRVPAQDFEDKSGDALRFKFADKDGLVESANGLAKVTLVKDPIDGEVLIKAKVKGAETAGGDGHATVSVSLLFGSDALADDCVAAPFMACTAVAGKKVACAAP